MNNYYLKLTKNQNNALEGLYNFQVKNHWKNYKIEYTKTQKGGESYMYDFTDKGLLYMGIGEDDIIY